MSHTGIVITGLGAVSPLGLNTQQTWESLLQGKSGIDTIKAFDPANFTCRIAGEVDEYKIKQYIPKFYRKAAKLMSRDIELSVIAAHHAFLSASVVTKAFDPEQININPERTAINVGAGLISCDLVELAPAVAASVTDNTFDIKKWGKDGIELVTPLWLLKYLPNMLACHIGIIHDIQGPGNTITCAETSGLLAIIEAADILERSNSDIALAGGAEAKVNPIVMIRQCLLNRTTSKGNDNPEAACRPFDADASGSVFGEGAGLVVLETKEHAKSRKAMMLAEIAGVGQSNNINPAYEHVESDGKGIQIAIEKALEQANIKSDDLDLIIPHGTGIAQDDQAEAKAIEAVVGEAVKNVPVWPTKSMLSNTGAACGALDVIAAVCAMRDNIIPAAKNFQMPIKDCRLKIVTEHIQKEIRYALCCGYTYGGQTAAIILKKATLEQNK